MMIGSRLGPYEITAKLGEGGMGEVYRATDSKLKREVALKVLPAAVSDDKERLARFEREAQLLAQLHHPNIASIFGLEESEGLRALVMELVEGEDLSQTIKRGPLPVDEALGMARQIAEALHFAHEQGVVHRDLKPANVRVRPDGVVKVLDFGLAKAMEPELLASGSPTTSPALMNSPTLTSAGTRLGVILGTAAYMSPEQAKGRPVDRRSDVWAFGCVLFEMLTGRRAFEGEDATEVLAAVVRGEPDWRALPSDVPREIRLLVERCLVKDRTRRLPDMGVACFLLGEPGALGAADTPAPVASMGKPRRARSFWAVAVVAAAAALLTLGLVELVRPSRSPQATAAATRRSHLSIALPDGMVLGGSDEMPLAISADGRLLAYIGLLQGKQRIYLRALDDPESRPVNGTEGARTPFFSPDDAWIAFFADGKLKKVSTTGAALQVLAEAPDGRGGSWGGDGNIYFAPTNIAGIWRVPEAGGEATQITRLDRASGEISHRWPRLMPDKKTLLYGRWTGPGNDECGLVAQSLDGSDRRVLVPGANMPLYLPGRGLLLYSRLDDLFAVRWTPQATSVGSVVPLSLSEHPRMEGEGANAVAIAGDDALVYIAGGAKRYSRRLVWVDPSGQTTEVSVSERSYQSATLSPDGTQAILQVEEGTVGPWMLDLARSTTTPFATGAGSSQAPVWTPDGKRIAYRGTRTGTRNLYWKAADGTGEEERLTEKADVTQTPSAISPDGHWLFYAEQGGGKRESRIWRVRLDGDRTPQPLHSGADAERNAHPSPDGRWLAFESLVSGRLEIYLEPLAAPGPRRQVSDDGGVEPLWSRDGRALFYRNGERLMRVDIGPGSVLAASTPRLLHTGPFINAFNWTTPYSVAADGRFLRILPSQTEGPLRSIDVVLNWAGELDTLPHGGQ